MATGSSSSQQPAVPLGILAVGAVVAVAAYAKSHKSRKGKGDSSGEDEAAAAASRAKFESETWESHVGEHTALREVWPGAGGASGPGAGGTLFVVEAAGSDRGPPVRNMCIYRVPDGSGRLVIYNGVAVDGATVARIEELGTPTVLVVPNYLHRCCAAVWKKRYPKLMVVCPLVARDEASKVVVVDRSTEEWAAMPDWKKWIRAKTIDGWGEFESVMEFELESTARGKKAVLVCDLLFTVPYNEDAGWGERLVVWLFDSSITPPPDGTIVIPKVARISRIFAIKDWTKAEGWYRRYAREHGRSVAVIVVGHGRPVEEMDPANGCAEAFEGVAEQLTRPRW